MQHGTLISIYFATGLGCGGFLYFQSAERGARVVASALVMVVLWPLWAPFALSSPSSPARGPLAARIAVALNHVAGPSALIHPEGVFRRGEAATLMRQVEAAERRLGELEGRLAAMQREDPVVDREDSDARARAQIRAASITQLEALRAREHTALVELAELCELLRTQQLLSRFGSSDRAYELRAELWARVQALSELDA